MRRVIVLMTYLFGFSYVLLAQPYVHISQVKDTALENGIKVLLVKDTVFEDVLAGLYIHYAPIRHKTFAGSDLVFAQLTGGQCKGRTLYKRIIITDSAGLDSSLRFLKQKVFDQDYTEGQVLMAVNDLPKQSIEQRAARVLSLGRNHFLSLQPSRYLTKDTVMLFRNRLKAGQITILVYGNFNLDSALLWIRKYYNSLLLRPSTVPSPLPPHKSMSVNFVDSGSVLRMGFAYAVRYNYARNFLNLEMLKYYLSEHYPQGKVTLEPAQDISVFSFFFSANELVHDFDKLRKILKDFSAKKINLVLFNKLKNNIKQQIDSIYTTPARWADMLYFWWQSKRPINQLNDFYKSIDTLTLTGFKPNFSPNQVQYIFIGKRLDYQCQLLELSRNYKIYLEDRNIYRYDVIQKGFNAWTVINNYLRFVAPKGWPKNLTLSFNGFFYTDSSFVDIFGTIYKKAPDRYRFDIYVQLPDDTLLLYQSIFDGKQWFDTSIVGSLPADTLGMERTDFFNERFYRKLGYKVKLICNPQQILKSIYIVQVTTPDSLIFFDYYDNSNKTKLYTYLHGGNGQWISTIYYYDYQRVEQGKDHFKIPFIIKEQTPYYTLELHINSISTAKIKRKVFMLSQRQK